MFKNLEKQVKKLEVKNQVYADYDKKIVEQIVGKKDEKHSLPNKTSYILTR